MKPYKIRSLFLSMLCMAIAFFTVPAVAQDVEIPYTNLTLSAVSTFTYTAGSNVLSARTVTVSTTGGDTVRLKVYSGNQNNALHFWESFTKVSGSTDSITTTLYGVVKSSIVGGGNTVWISLYTAQTANSSGEQVFHYVSTGNNYTDYYLVTKKIGVAAGAGQVKYLCLVR